MANNVKQRLEEIKDEVREFHPLLERLFKKLQPIDVVEYTHGTQEMGADFVLTRRHDIFKTTEYIGVVAKVGKILQDYTDIERQIEECTLQRTIAGGKRRVRLNEVWVVATQTISKGAQDKINDKYETTKVLFIDGSTIADLIDEHIPDYWTNIPVEVGDYLSNLRTRNEASEQKHSLLPIESSFYVEQDVYTFENDYYDATAKRRKTKPSKVKITDEIVQHPVLLVEGGMGAGKSKLLRQITDHYTDPEVFMSTNYLPITITFKEFHDSYQCDLSALVSSVTNNIPQHFLKAVTYLVLIDSVDEKDLPLDEQIRIINSLSETARADGRIRAIVTSRYLRSFDRSKSLGFFVARYEIRPLSTARIIEFLNKICSSLNIKSRIIEDLKKSQLFAGLPKSPIAAIILAHLIQENSEDLPSNMTELYAKYVELMLGRWDIEKGLESQKEYEALSHILMQLSSYVIEEEYDGISVSQVKNVFSDYLTSRNLSINSDDLFAKLVKRSELVFFDTENDTIKFKHRTFAEFLYAKLTLQKGNVQFDQRVFHMYWLSVNFFLLGLIKDAPIPLNTIINLKPESEAEEWIKLMNMGNYFLAAYTTPYSVINAGMTNVAIEAASLYRNITQGGATSPFSKFTRMQLLYLFQFLFRYNYSYSFLKNAMEEAALNISTQSIDEDTKAYALFFLNVAYIDVGDGGTFDFMLDKKSSSLPLDVSLAIQHEAENLKTRSDLMRKHDKRVTRFLRDNRMLHNNQVNPVMNDLYKKPIASLKQVTGSNEGSD